MFLEKLENLRKSFAKNFAFYLYFQDILLLILPLLTISFFSIGHRIQLCKNCSFVDKIWFSHLILIKMGLGYTQKEPSRGVLKKRCSWKLRKVYAKTLYFVISHLRFSTICNSLQQLYLLSPSVKLSTLLSFLIKKKSLCRNVLGSNRPTINHCDNPHAMVINH